jgi:hypothetical protein
MAAPEPASRTIKVKSEMVLLCSKVLHFRPLVLRRRAVLRRRLVLSDGGMEQRGKPEVLGETTCHSDTLVHTNPTRTDPAVRQ